MKLNIFIVYTATSLFLLNFNIISCTNNIWMPLAISMAHMNSSLNRAIKLLAQSDMVCAMQASRIIWSNTLSFSDGICTVSSYMATYEYNSLGGNSISNQTNTMIKLYATCIPPFKLVAPYGCFALSSLASTFNNSRSYCQSIGGDIWTFEENQTQAYVGAIRNTAGFTGTAVWFGVYGTTSKYAWLSGNAFNSSQFGIYYMQSSPPYSGACIVVGYSSAMWVHLCTDGYRAMCQQMVKLN